MGQLMVNTFTSLDGVMQAPGMPDEDRDGGFDHGGWQVPYFDDQSGRFMVEQMGRIDALLLGRKTYEIFAAYWPNVPDEDPIVAKLNSVPKFVVSRTLDKVAWNNSALIKGDLAEAVNRLKAEYDEVNVTGSSVLIQDLIRLDLVDQFNVWIYPVLLGSGKRLFGGGTIPTALRLVDSRTFSSGAVILSYQRAGKPTYGSAALDTHQA